MEERIWVSASIFILLCAFVGIVYPFHKHLRRTGGLFSAKTTDQTRVMAIPIIITLACILLAIWLLVQAILFDYHGQAVVSGYSLEVLENDFWTNMYGSEYTIGDDSFKQKFCLPSEQFAMMTITFSCPLFVKPCQSSLVAWSCPYRQICPENCVINGDDAFQNNNGQQRCDNTDDDAYFQQQADDAAADDDQQEQRVSEEELYECVQNAYPLDSTIGIYADCKNCRALQDEDYRWAVSKNSSGGINDSPNINETALKVVTILGFAAIIGTIAIHYGYDYIVNTDDDDDDDELRDGNGISMFSISRSTTEEKKTSLMGASYMGEGSGDAIVNRKTSDLDTTSDTLNVSALTVASGADATQAAQSGTMA